MSRSSSENCIKMQSCQSVQTHKCPGISVRLSTSSVSNGVKICLNKFAF